MKNVKLLSLAFSMLICFVAKAQEKTVDSNFVKHDTTNSRVVICAPSKRSLMSEPLYILDGIVVNSKKIAKVNPNDIESIKVLKGIEATSIYGSQGINGAILITSKEKK